MRITVMWEGQKCILSVLSQGYVNAPVHFHNKRQTDFDHFNTPQYSVLVNYMEIRHVNQFQ